MVIGVSRPFWRPAAGLRTRGPTREASPITQPVPNTDKNNAAVRTLAGLAVGALAVGAVLLLVGLTPPPSSNAYSPGPDHNYPVLFAGLGLLGLALQLWIVLLVFWAWRTEHRGSPVAPPNLDRQAAPGPPHEGRQAAPPEVPAPAPLTEVGRTPPPLPEVGTQAPSDTALWIRELAGRQVVTVLHGGQNYLLVNDLAAVMDTTADALAQVCSRRGLKLMQFNYAMTNGPEATSQRGWFLDAAAVALLVRRIPSLRRDELLAFIKQ